MNLKNENLNFLPAEISIPNYNRNKIKTGIVHVGIGGFHRAHQAFLTDKLLQNENQKNWGICGVALLEFDLKIYNVLKNQDGLYTLIIKQFDGSTKTKVIGSITECLFAPDNQKAVINKMASSDTKIISLTITEGGYNYNETTLEFIIESPLIQHDLKNKNKPLTIFGYLTQALQKRKELNLGGLTILSCDNIQGNGDITKKMLLSYVQVANPELTEWITNNVSFPNSMVDRITPATTPADISLAKELLSINDQWPVVCEPFIQWVIEDNFIAGRPKWENVGAQFVKDVVPYEKMKLSLLNAGHSVLGIIGALLGYTTIDEVIKDEAVKQFLIDFMNIEVTPILGKLENLDIEDYKKSLIQRFGNKNIKDQVSRICLESSTKLPKFLFPTIKAQLEKKNQVTHGAFLIAAWNIYSLGIDKNGKNIDINDKMSQELKTNALASKENPLIFITNKNIFGDFIDHENFNINYLKAYQKINELGVKKSVLDINAETKYLNNNKIINS